MPSPTTRFRGACSPSTGGSANLTAIDPRSGKIVGALELGGKPEFAQTDGRGRMFVNIEDKSELVAFDGRTLAIQNGGRWRRARSPAVLAIDRARHRLFLGVR
jgi:hypothetical protein